MTRIPVLEYRVANNNLTYRYSDIVPEFDMPVRVYIDKEQKWLFPSSEWKTEEIEGDPETLEIDTNFYIMTAKL